jgi:putative ABC transport system permease protein
VTLRRQVLPLSARVGLETLKSNPTRTALSTLGVVMGAASLVAVLSLGDGAESFARQQIERRGLQVVAIQPRTSDTVDGLVVPRSDVPEVTPEDLHDLLANVPPGG